MRYKYNRQLTPPAPFVHVRAAGPTSAGAVEEIPAPLDSAADRSAIPWSVVEALQLPQLDELPALGFGGHLVSVPTYLVELTVRGLTPITIEAFASREEPYVLLGRDVLNHFRVLLDGPNLVLEMD
ncbi:MAG TPA: hypothetical protein PLF81_10635 [Candidatus Anammoximicrobium sp.]|nr:hypothetical protein [Candidatus Anammoximicrobium sp.]